MKMVIDVPDEVIETRKYDRFFGVGSTKLTEVIENGIPYKERPQGEWKEYKLRNDIVVEYAFKCSNCKKDSGLPYRTDFCPNCGAAMRGYNE